MNARPFNPFGPFGGPVEGVSFFPKGFFDKIFPEDLAFPAPVRRSDREEGTILEFNLAGFAADEVSVKVDTALKQLVVKAIHKQPNERRNVETKINLSPYVKASDISSFYDNGLLTVTLANAVKADDVVVEIPVTTFVPDNDETPISEKLDEAGAQ